LSVSISVAVAVAVAIGVAVSIVVVVGVDVVVTATGEIVGFVFGNKELVFEDAFIEFVNKEDGEVLLLLLKVFNLLLFIGINGI
jgi:hypothetical protein